ncbi:hypothetical protein COS59_02010 [Candidatus Wolfebacteria bacterium CG03_land_8_20_14_0_80_36_15]|uniref:Protein containing YHS domain protein n=1 Tax=Candidatus Wolfebacteria bacterium CG03_land_8_20_14_0_80_36_15 TaxID=1975067 RepID=A0A2M7B7G3_9BACT|nr:MAG: hypothetical protein COS59_02010 [Candidatus Wolfebacteria bacterium CG03_land_8_20_14_0_80_36_15]
MDTYPKYKICVSGAAETSHCGPEAFKVAEELGEEIASRGLVLVDGATTGFPLWAAKGAKQNGGIVVGISPASSQREHIERFELPVDYHDLIIYTGFGYSGRNLLLTRAADAVIIGCGRMGTVNEFTIAFEDKKPIGILEGGWETDEVVKNILEKSRRQTEHPYIVFNSVPAKLLDKLLLFIKERENKINNKGRC